MGRALGANPSMNGAELGKIICDTYMEGCLREGTERSATLSLVDLGKLPVLNMTYNALGLEAVVRSWKTNHSTPHTGARPSPLKTI